MKHRYFHNYTGLCSWKTLLEVDTVTFIVVEAGSIRRIYTERDGRDRLLNIFFCISHVKNKWQRGRTLSWGKHLAKMLKETGGPRGHIKCLSPSSPIYKGLSVCCQWNGYLCLLPELWPFVFSQLFACLTILIQL